MPTLPKNYRFKTKTNQKYLADLAILSKVGLSMDSSVIDFFSF